MENLLPKVKPGVGACLEHELLKTRADKAYIKEELEKIKKENPIISFWIETFAEKTKDKKGAIFCALWFLKCLEYKQCVTKWSRK